MQSPATVANLFQGWVCFGSDDLLHTLVVRSAYSRNIDINKPFSLRGLQLTGHFLFSRPFSVNPRNACKVHENRRRSADPEILTAAFLAPTAMRRSNSLKSTL